MSEIRYSIFTAALILLRFRLPIHMTPRNRGGQTAPLAYIIAVKARSGEGDGMWLEDLWSCCSDCYTRSMADRASTNSHILALLLYGTYERKKLFGNLSRRLIISPA